MKDTLFFLLCGVVFTILIVFDVINGRASLNSTHTRFYLIILVLLYGAAAVSFTRYLMFLRVQKQMQKKWGSWKIK